MKLIRKIQDFMTLGMIGFILFAAVPIAGIIVYYSFLASPIYKCKTTFALQSPSPSMGSELGAMQALQLGAANNDIHVMSEYIRSTDMLEKLMEAYDLRGHYSAPSVDSLSRLRGDAPWSKLQSYLKDKIVPDVNWDSQVVNLTTYTYEPKFCVEVSEGVLLLAEKFVNEMTDEIHRDFRNFANMHLIDAENEIAAVRGRLTTYRSENNVFDPVQQAQSVLGIIGTLEQEYTDVQVKLSELRRSHRVDSPAVKSLMTRLNALDRQIGEEKKKLASQERTQTLSTELEEYEALQMQHEFAKQRYALAMELWEIVQSEALQKTRYLITIQKPKVPEVADSLKPFKDALGHCVTVLLAYLVLGIILMAIKDHADA